MSRVLSHPHNNFFTLATAAVLPFLGLQVQLLNGGMYRLVRRIPSLLMYMLHPSMFLIYIKVNYLFLLIVFYIHGRQCLLVLFWYFQVVLFTVLNKMKITKLLLLVQSTGISTAQTFFPLSPTLMHLQPHSPLREAMEDIVTRTNDGWHRNVEFDRQHDLWLYCFVLDAFSPTPKTFWKHSPPFLTIGFFHPETEALMCYLP